MSDVSDEMVDAALMEAGSQWGDFNSAENRRLLMRAALEAAERTRALSQLEAGKGDISDQAQFLLDRLSELEWSDIPDDFWRDWNGHVEPAIARLRSALASPSPAPEAEPVAVPDGWVLVPVDPTEKMVEYAQMTHTSDLCDADVEDIYRTMLRNAPTPAVDADAVIEAKLQSLAADILALKLHPATSEEYDAGYIAARNDAFAIIQEAADNAS